MTRVFDPSTEKYAPINFQVWRADRDRKLKAYTEVGMGLLARVREQQAEQSAQQ